MKLDRAFSDVKRAIAERQIWRVLAMRNFRHSYRRTFLGPIWHSIDQLLFTFSFALLRTLLFGGSFKESFAYVGVGIAVFSALTQTTLTTLNSIVGSASLKNSGLSVTGRVARDMLSVAITFGFRITPLVVALPLTGFPWTLTTLWVLPMTLLSMLGGLAVGLQLSIAYTRFRDLEPIISLILRLAFFLSPVFWHPSAGTQRAELARLTEWNLFAHYISIVRDPLLGEVPPSTSVWIVVVFTALCLVSSLVVLGSSLDKISYWLG